MTFRERQLYHQIHPAKLATDISAQIVSLVFFWQHALVVGLVAMFLPPIVASALVIRFADLTWLKDSRLGRYIAWEMTPAMQAVRLAGTLPMVLGAWWHAPWLIALGLAIVLFGWLRGAMFGR
jgi:hypothetical protein